MIAVDNKLPQPPNAKWNDIASSPPPSGQQLAFTDTTKTYAWIGYVSNKDAPLPMLKAAGALVTDQQPAFWSLLSDQP